MLDVNLSGVQRNQVGMALWESFIVHDQIPPTTLGGVNDNPFEPAELSIGAISHFNVVEIREGACEIRRGEIAKLARLGCTALDTCLHDQGSRNLHARSPAGRA